MATAALTLKTPALRASRRAERFAWAVAGYNVLVVLWGALVRATGSGAGCSNNWPLCNGQVIPIAPTWHTWIEFTHRQMVTGSVLAMIALAAWTWRSTLQGAAARVCVVAASILLVNEAFLGALLVKLGYVAGNRSPGRALVLSVHLSNTLLLLAALTLTALMLGSCRQWSALKARGRDKALAAVGLAATLVVGVSGSLAALGDTLFPASTLRAAFAADFDRTSPLLLRLRGIHPASAFLAAAFVVWLLMRARRTGLVREVRLVACLLIAQFALGVGDVLLLAPTWMQILHLFAADLYWIALITLAARTLWPDRDRSAIADRGAAQPGLEPGV